MKPDPAAVVGSRKDKCDAIGQERAWLSLLGWGNRVERALAGIPGIVLKATLTEGA
jgi:hypothetical protein